MLTRDREGSDGRFLPTALIAADLHIISGLNADLQNKIFIKLFIFGLHTY